MVFKRLLGSLGVGGPTVDTVLTAGATVPGGSLSGQVHLLGGTDDFDIEHITLELVARVEAEHEDGESHGAVVFERFVVGGGFRLPAGAEHSLPFTVTLPWETPVTELYGQGLGIVLGVRTELSVVEAPRTRVTWIRSSSAHSRYRRRSSKPSGSSASVSGPPTSNTAASRAPASSCPSTRRSSFLRPRSTHTRSMRSR